MDSKLISDLQLIHNWIKRKTQITVYPTSLARVISGTQLTGPIQSNQSGSTNRMSRSTLSSPGCQSYVQCVYQKRASEVH